MLAYRGCLPLFNAAFASGQGGSFAALGNLVGGITKIATGGAETAGGFVPLVGEAQDLSVLFGSQSSIAERSLAGGSLLLNLFTAGFAPNAGGAIRGSQRLTNTTIDVVGDRRVVSQFDTMSGVRSANPNSVERVGRQARDWLGEWYVVKRHDTVGAVFQSKDKLRQFRLDLQGHGDLPHGHLQMRGSVTERFKDSPGVPHRLYFQDVTQTLEDNDGT